MSRMYTISLNTLRENLRDKFFYNLVLFGLFMMGSFLLLAQLSMGEQEKLIKDFGLASINLFGVAISIFVGIGLISKEVERRTIFTIISKPVPRWEFILGRYMGLLLTLMVNVLVMTIGLFAVLLIGSVYPDWGLMKAIVLIFMELAILVAFATLFSTFTTPTLSAMFTIAIFVIGSLTEDLKVLGEKLGGGGRELFQISYYILPNLQVFNVKGEAAYGIPIGLTSFSLTIGYGVTYTTIILLLACWIFQRRDF